MSQIQILEIKPEETWVLRHEVMWPDQTIDYVKLEEDSNGQHFGLKVDGKILSVISVFVEGGHAQFRKFATDTAEQGKGYGSTLLSHIIQLLEEQGVLSIWCNSRVEKSSFYRKFGLRETTKTFTKGGIDYVIMEKVRS